MGSYREPITANDEAAKDRLKKGLMASLTATFLICLQRAIFQ